MVSRPTVSQAMKGIRWQPLAFQRRFCRARGSRSFGIGDFGAHGASAGHLAAIHAGKKRFQDQVVARIERATGLTGGQLAALADETEGGPMTDFFNVLAEAKNTPSHRRRPVARGQGTVHSGPRTRQSSVARVRRARGSAAATCSHPPSRRQRSDVCDASSDS